MREIICSVALAVAKFKLRNADFRVNDALQRLDEAKEEIHHAAGWADRRIAEQKAAQVAVDIARKKLDQAIRAQAFGL